MSAQDDKKYYQWLGVTANATARDIQQAYRQAAKQLHPDKLSSSSSSSSSDGITMEQLNEAYHILGNETLRKEYDVVTMKLDDNVKVPLMELKLFPTTVHLSLLQWWSGCTVTPTRSVYQPCTSCSLSSSSSCSQCMGQRQILHFCQDPISISPRCALSSLSVPQVHFQISPRTWHAWEYDPTTEQISVVMNSWSSPVCIPDNQWYQFSSPSSANAASEGWFVCTTIPRCWVYVSSSVQLPWSDVLDWELVQKQTPSIQLRSISVASPTEKDTPPARSLTESTCKNQ